MTWRTFIIGLTAVASLTGCGDNAGNVGRGQPDGGPDWGPAPEIAATPEFDPPEGTFTNVPRVTIRTDTPGATIHYTMNGSTPDSTSPIYTLPLAIARTTTIKAIARRPGSRDSEVRSATYDIDVPQGNAAPVQFEPNTGRYSNDVHVTLSSSTAGATICYTIDGTKPACAKGPGQYRDGDVQLRRPSFCDATVSNSKAEVPSPSE
ncbi:chitobiase/beta-hexosaminidase C-terminal domain-containing protein [Pendulispora rubella]|uniref:Chitobiase/beta-hexosaminidase C-terminal domain-containing protein n=1 Tax=Pendulispora rubella TaxID=2741070 RepID=A0ABZ2KSN3_9BACT